MTKDEAYENLRRQRISLERENLKLKARIDEFDATTYISAEKAANLKQINTLTQENNYLKKEINRYKINWQRQISITENLRAAHFDVECEKDEIKAELELYKQKAEELEARLKVVLNEAANHDADYEARIAALTDALLKEHAKANNDGTNSGTPTSQTPYSKKKKIPNTRERSDRKRGAQPGHEKHTLTPLSSNEITDTVVHTLDSCPNCRSKNLIYVESKSKDVIDYKVVFKKVRHEFYVYKCTDCGHIVHSNIPLHLKESVQYGENIQALALALSNIGFVSFNRSKKLIEGILGNEINLSEGFLCKLQKRASKELKTFVEDTRLACIKSKRLHWDDTVIFVNTKQACMRFYGNDKLALYKAHEKKNREGIDEDAILGALGSETTVIHDHVTMNYNADFHFRNAECVQHLLRDIQKIIDCTEHSWAIEMKELISKTIHRRNELVANGAEKFSTQELGEFLYSIDVLLELASKEYEASAGHYYEDDERRLITRIAEYKENYFLWAKDFTVAPTNNLAERSLRGQKVKLKVSGQFQNIKNAEFFADIRTYIETCYRNGINAFDALTRLAAKNPFTLSEILGEA